MNFQWDDEDPTWVPVPCMSITKAKVFVDCMCAKWWADHPGDRHLPWQAVLYKVLRASAINGGYSMYVCHSSHGMLISDFALVDRAALSSPYHG